MKKYDAVIIGFGKGGKTLAGKLAAAGKQVALIEKSREMYGGTCINVGCIPSKSLIRSSGLAALDPDASFEEKTIRYQKAMQEKRRLIAMLRDKNFHKLADLPNIMVYDGIASFISETKVQITTESNTDIIEGEKIFINTGSTPVIPSIPGIAGNPFVHFSNSMLDLDTLPRRLVIIGGGYIGLEFASMYAGFGSDVTVISHGPEFLPREDADIAQEIKHVLESKGITFLLETDTQKISHNEREALLTLTCDGVTKPLAADAVLIATGRRPNTDGLNTEAAGIELTERGAVKVDENNRTTAKDIWAMGDVAGRQQFTYVSLDDFRIVWSQLNDGEYDAGKRTYVPNSVFIDPPYSRVGMNEKEALRAGRNIEIKKMPAAAVPKAQVLKKPDGMLKAVIDKDTGKILGAMLFCEESYEVINIIKLAMDLDADYTVLKNQIFTHPTMSEALNDLF